MINLLDLLLLLTVLLTAIYGLLLACFLFPVFMTKVLEGKLSTQGSQKQLQTCSLHALIHFKTWRGWWVRCVSQSRYIFQILQQWGIFNFVLWIVNRAKFCAAGPGHVFLNQSSIYSTYNCVIRTPLKLKQILRQMLRINIKKTCCPL